MEIRARFLQMGMFTLAVIAAAFAFAYWLNTAGALGQRKPYLVVFDAPVSGLLRGSGVLFNGIRVGEVTNLALDATAPSRVRVEIAVEISTPVRADTVAGLDFQGLSGAPVVVLSGGSIDKPLLNASGRDLPTLTADNASTRSMSQAARDVLGRFDTLLAQNAAPLRSTITNLETFSGALARNSDRLDGIVAGIERMTGGGAKAKPTVFDLKVPAVAAATSAFALQLTIPDPSLLSALDNERIQVAGGGGVLQPLADAQWSDTLPRLVQFKMIRALEDAMAFSGVSRPLEGIGSDLQLLLDIRRFEIDAENRAHVEIVGKIASGKGRITATGKFAADAMATGSTASERVAALDRSFGQAAGEIATWLQRSVKAQASEKR